MPKYPPLKQALFDCNTALMEVILQGENFSLFVADPSVARGNIIKFPC